MNPDLLKLLSRGPALPNAPMDPTFDYWSVVEGRSAAVKAGAAILDAKQHLTQVNATEIIKAFIILNEGFEPTTALADELKLSVHTRLAKHEMPRLIEFVDSLPMTTTGKIMRRELRLAEAEKLKNA